MGTLIERLSAVIVVMAIVALPPAAGARADQASATTYNPPYGEGPQGGDSWNFIQTDPEAGRIGILRAFPGVTPVVGCTPQADAGWAMFRIEHKVTSPVSAITASFDAYMDGYSWVTLGARDARMRWLGVKKFQGPNAGAEELTVELFRQPRKGEMIFIEFGVQLGDACQQLGGALATFSSVEVQS